MSRIQGTIKQLSIVKPIFGIVQDDAGNEYFFIPSLMLYKQAYWRLVAGQMVEFEPFEAEQGWRAKRITVPSSVSHSAGHHGEETSPR